MNLDLHFMVMSVSGAVLILIVNPIGICADLWSKYMLCLSRNREEWLRSKSSLYRSFAMGTVDKSFLMSLLLFTPLPSRVDEHMQNSFVQAWLDRATLAAGYPSGLNGIDWLRVILLAGITSFLSGIGLSSIWPVAFWFASTGIAIIWLRRRIRMRRNELLKEIVPWMRVLSILLDSGLDFQKSWQISLLGSGSVLRPILKTGNDLLCAGSSVAEVWRKLAEYSGLKELLNTGASVATQQKTGGEVASVLAVSSAEFEEQYFAWLEQRALEAPVAIMPGLMIVFAAVFLLVLAPVANLGL